MNALIIFMKNPVKGKAKTRLAAAVGKDRAHVIYLELLDYTKKLTLKVDCERYLFYTDKIEKDDWSDNNFVKQLQDGDDLGIRMENAFDAILDYGNEKAVIIGSDCGELTKEIVEQAFKDLDDNDVVIGPAQDGGYYLLGMKDLHSFIFQNKAWSTSGLFEATVSEIKEKGMSISVLPVLNDVDEYEDYLKWRAL